MELDNGYGYQGGDASYGFGNENDYGKSNSYGAGNFDYVTGVSGATSAPPTPTKTSVSKHIIPIVASMIGRLIVYNTDSFNYFNFPVMHVSACGLVSSYRNNSAGSIDYVINDCTGTINGRYYSNANTGVITEGYVKIVGVLKEFQGRVSVNIQNIEPIYDVNLIVQHVLSSIASYCYYKKKNGSIDNKEASFANAEADFMNNQDSMGLAENIIYTFVKTQMDLPENSYGVSLDKILNHCAAKGISESDVRFTVEGMVSDIRLFESGPDMYKCQ